MDKYSELDTHFCVSNSVSDSGQKELDSGRIADGIVVKFEHFSV